MAQHQPGFDAHLGRGFGFTVDALTTIVFLAVDHQVRAWVTATTLK